MNILLDCDGPLADLVGGILAVVNRGRCSHTHLKASDCAGWNIADSFGLTSKYVDEIMSTKGFCLGLSEVEDACWRVEALRRDHSVRVVTAPFVESEYWMHERLRWLRRLHFDNHDVIFASNKSLIRGDVLVDDKPSNILHWAQAWPDGLGLLWDAPYNRKFAFELPPNTKRVRGWDEVMAEIEGMR